MYSALVNKVKKGVKAAERPKDEVRDQREYSSEESLDDEETARRERKKARKAMKKKAREEKDTTDSPGEDDYLPGSTHHSFVWVAFERVERD